MVIDQRNAGASQTINGDVYTLDRWKAWVTVVSKFSVQQNAGSVTPPAGFTNYLGCTSLAATSVGAGDYYVLEQAIEGFNTADLDFGKSTAKTFTLSFWVRSSLTGTFGGSLNNAGFTRSYPFTYTISSANTWEQKFITIAGDTSGSWIGATNGVGMGVWFSLGAGSSFSGPANAWATANYLTATGATNVVSTNGATFYLTGVQLEVGTQATTFTTAGGSFGAELQLCQRYYYQITAGGSAFTQFGAGRAFSTTAGNGIVPFPVPMRTAPTFAFLGVVGNYDFGPTAIAAGAVPASNTHMTVGMTFSSITNGSMFWLGQSASATPCGFTFSSEL
jgi:hypothetical protein